MEKYSSIKAEYPSYHGEIFKLSRRNIQAIKGKYSSVKAEYPGYHGEIFEMPRRSVQAVKVRCSSCQGGIFKLFQKSILVIRERYLGIRGHDISELTEISDSTVFTSRFARPKYFIFGTNAALFVLLNL